jgi:haloalkane dehalogenase
MRAIEANGRTIAYRELGTGPATILLHGWPTSSLLWADVMPAMAGRGRVIAMDLPGFGGSDKPTDVRYTFGFFTSAIDALLGELDIEQVAVVGHDLGGPLALRWALDNPDRVTRVALLNTLVYPEFSAEVVEFVTSLADPVSRVRVTSPEQLAGLIRLGVSDPAHVSDELLAAMLEPFGSEQSRTALALAGIGLERKGFADLAQRLPQLRVPLRIVYGMRDRLLPDVAETMARVGRDVPQADVTALADCGHFVQLDAPAEVGRLLSEFLAGTLSTS